MSPVTLENQAIMLRLAHFSDPHLAPLPEVRTLDLFSKRITGYLNYRKNRENYLSDDTLQTLVDDLKAQQPVHIALTGDLINIALDEEVENASKWLRELGTPDMISLVGGNHDAYVPGAFSKAKAAWKPYLLGDNDENVSFPYVRRRGQMTLIGLSSAVAKPPFFATGTLGKVQLAHLDDTLKTLSNEKSCKIILIHHPPERAATHWHKRLTDGDKLVAILKKHGADLVLHGHTHKRSTVYLEGPEGKKISVVGTPSAASSFHGHGEPAGYNILEIEEENTGWSITHIMRDLVGPGEFAETARTNLT